MHNRAVIARLHQVCPSFYAYTWRDLFVLVPRMSGGEFDLASRLMDQHAARSAPDKIGVMMYVRPGTPRPSAEERAAYDAYTERHKSDLACMAVLITGQGFFASAFIAMGSMAMAFKREDFPRARPRTSGRWPSSSTSTSTPVVS